MSQWTQQPDGARRARHDQAADGKDDEEGVGTGKTDFLFDFIASKEINQRVELSGYGGFMFRGDPDEVDLSDGLRWGFGAGFPTRKGLRVTAELHGEKQFDDVVYSGAGSARLIGEDGSLPPLVSGTDTQTHFTLGLTGSPRAASSPARAPTGASASRAASDFGPWEDRSGDSFGFQVRIGYHPGVRVYPPPPPPPPPPAPAPTG